MLTTTCACTLTEKCVVFCFLGMQEVLKDEPDPESHNVSRRVAGNAGNMHVFTATSLTDVMKDFSEVNPTRVALGCLLMVSICPCRHHPCYW